MNRVEHQKLNWIFGVHLSICQIQVKNQYLLYFYQFYEAGRTMERRPNKLLVMTYSTFQLTLKIFIWIFKAVKIIALIFFFYYYTWKESILKSYFWLGLMDYNALFCCMVMVPKRQLRKVLFLVWSNCSSALFYNVIARYF